MWLSFFIARKYFLSTKAKFFVNIISIFCLLVLTSATAAIVIVFSTYNGLTDQLRGIYQTFDPEIKIAPAQGKTFPVVDSLIQKIKATPGVVHVTEVLEDDAVLEYTGYGNNQSMKIVKVKGVSENFLVQNHMDTTIMQGEFVLKGDNQEFAVMSRMFQYQMGIPIPNDKLSLSLKYPKREVGNKASYNNLYIRPGGSFHLEQRFDEYIFVPLAFAEALMDAKGLRTSIEVKTTNGESVEEVQDQLKKLLGKCFTIQNQDQQHSYLYKAVKIEKLITYFILTCLLAIASLNLLLTLTMMTQNKKHDIATLKTIGAGERMIRLIFLCEGAIIGLFSGVFGLLIGAGLCYLQQQFGFIRINADSGFSSYYPVKMEAVDFGVALLTTIGISLLFSIGPAIQASKITIKDHI